MNIILLEI